MIINNYSIKQISEILNIPKASLRYYDELGLVCPKRGENRYRYYDDKDILDLRYLEMMKFCGFSLSEIGEMFKLRRNPDVSNHPVLNQLLEEKEQYLDKKIEIYKSVKLYFGKFRELMAQKKSIEDIAKIDRLVEETFKALFDNNKQEEKNL